ncbi:hypothetical protein [Oecophyllibacter saccharovorans]|uniref:Uncharacterized protein n=1 Tax=Oecophyllibacter saccharovorans TaxID=2558360 RepID=A0A506UQU0_9PROT|nr:hypothetical protein [Oecophyllibacter saccharovorans]TPW35706.1 hypothetical protein E3202_01760 [Oecophyllibacter saccharovorans]
MVVNARNTSEHRALSVQTPVSHGNVIALRQKFLKHHRIHLEKWLVAAAPMGILDGQITGMGSPSPSSQAGHEQIVIWVRENASPAYCVHSAGNSWVVMDALQQLELGRFPKFCLALHRIRPVLPLDGN